MTHQEYLSSDFRIKTMREFEEQEGRPKEKSFRTFYYQGKKYKQYDGTDDWIDIGPQLFSNFGAKDRVLVREQKSDLYSEVKDNLRRLILKLSHPYITVENSLEELFETSKGYILLATHRWRKGREDVLPEFQRERRVYVRLCYGEG